MLIVLVLMYLLLACFAGWLLLLPAGRDVLLQSMTNLGLARNRRSRRLNGHRASRATAFGHRPESAYSRSCRFFRRYPLLWRLALLLIVVPCLSVLLFSQQNIFDGYDSGSRVSNVQVSERLNREPLVPPEPPVPPPLVFSTLEVARIRPLLGPASRNWQMLNHDFRQRLLLVFQIMKETHGYDMALLEGYRSPERQNLLAAAGPGVTNAKAFQSYHQFGLAADCAFFRDGKLLISERDPWILRGYRLYGEVAESVGLSWGGRWTRKDFGHAELRVLGRRSK